jgi:hypothetical protein
MCPFLSPWLLRGCSRARTQQSGVCQKRPGYHPGIVTGSFTVLRFPMNGGGVDSEPPTIYQEMYTGALYLDKPTEVERFDAAFEAIWDTALDERSSRTLISKTAEDMRHG